MSVANPARSDAVKRRAGGAGNRPIERQGLGMLARMPPLTLAHLNLDVTDLDRSERFYRDVLGLPVVRRVGSLLVQWSGGLVVLAAGKPVIDGTFHFGFQVAADMDVDVWFERLRALAVTVIEAPADRGAVYVGRLSDPDGYPIEIYSQRAAPPA